MSLDAQIRAAERASDQAERVRLLMRAGRRQAEWQVGDLVELIPPHPEAGKRGRVGAVEPSFSVIFDEEHPRRQLTLRPSDWQGTRPNIGRFGLFGVGWVVAIESVKLVEIAECLPPLVVDRVCWNHRQGWGTRGDGTYGTLPECSACGRDAKLPNKWRTVNGQPVEDAPAPSGERS